MFDARNLDPNFERFLLAVEIISDVAFSRSLVLMYLCRSGPNNLLIFGPTGESNLAIGHPTIIPFLLGSSQAYTVRYGSSIGVFVAV
jgi:hypothetical protein